MAKFYYKSQVNILVSIHYNIHFGWTIRFKMILVVTYHSRITERLFSRNRTFLNKIV